MSKGHSAVLACAGAVIGAGFASGREIVTFFTIYGQHGWWLMMLAALLMAALCGLCMQAAKTDGYHWLNAIQCGWAAKVCPIMLMTLTAGAMISAAGHLSALLWNHPWAYGVGMMGTILAAWRMANGRMKALNLLSGVLTLVLLCALMAAFLKLPAEAVEWPDHFSWKVLGAAAIRSVGYAAMNIMLAIGVICRSAEKEKNHWVAAGLFGWIIGMLLFISQCVYSRFPASGQMAFPVIVLLSGYGRTGYLAGIVLLYLSVITTLTSVFYALRTAAAGCIVRRDVQYLLVLGIPLAVSGIGFEAIVDRLYAPAGLFCLIAIFLPMAFRVARKQVFLDNSD